MFNKREKDTMFIVDRGVFWVSCIWHSEAHFPQFEASHQYKYRGVLYTQ